MSQTIFTVAVLFAAAFSAGVARPAFAALVPEHPRCEYLVNPIGVDEPRPRLSWTYAPAQDPAARGAKQTAYQIVVASSEALLDSGKPDLWDSGRIESAEQNQIEYAGKPLASRQQCFWRVQAFDASGRPGPWSQVASWEVGLATPGDWHAKWIQDGLPGGTFEIIDAKYVSEDRRTGRDITAVLRDKMKNGPVELKLDNATLGGDPAPQKHKIVVLHYKIDGGPTLETTYKEDSRLWLPLRPPQVMRKTFAVDRPVKRARLYATALGIYDLRLNGKPVTDAVFTPDWTSYTKRVRYQAYDVTALVSKGANALGGSVADGFYSGHIANGAFQHYGSRPAVMAQLELTYDDGSIERIVTDDTWRTHSGPVKAADVMNGEAYDARVALDGSDPTLADDGHWAKAEIKTEGLPPVISPQVTPPVRELLTLPAKTVTEPTPGKYLFDLGQNMVGVARIHVNAPAGTVVTIRFAEMLNNDGTPYTDNYRGAKSTDYYVCRGGGPETWQPTFTYHGFRYVELSGLPEKPTTDAVVGVVQGSDTPIVGTFACSDPRINQLQSNILWGQRGNFFGVPTDCPQRDERLGWMGDAQVFIGTAARNADVAAFFTKWLVDVDDEQLPDGRFASTAPDTDLVASGSPGWGDAGVICPWTIYQTYGDKRQLARHLPAMMKWVDWSKANTTNLIRDKNRGSDFGDWLSIGANTSKELLATSYFAHCADLVSRSAKIVGDDANAAKYAQLFEDIKAAYRAKHVHPDGTIGDGTQTAYALALAFDLLPENERPAAAAKLADDVKAKGNHLSTGFLGVSYLLPALSDHGQPEMAYTLLMQDTFPSWLFSVKHGATTIWERWDGWTPDKGFQDKSMNSFNHYSLGSCGQWLYDTVGGVGQPKNAIGYAHVNVAPLIGGRLTHATADYGSIRGVVRSAWKVDGNQLTLDVTVPPNVTATVTVPTRSPEAVTESGQPAATSHGVKAAGTTATAATFEIGSGTYRFAAPR